MSEHDRAALCFKITGLYAAGHLSIVEAVDLKHALTFWEPAYGRMWRRYVVAVLMAGVGWLGFAVATGLLHHG